MQLGGQEEEGEGGRKVLWGATSYREEKGEEWEGIDESGPSNSCNVCYKIHVSVLCFLCVVYIPRLDGRGHFVDLFIPKLLLHFFFTNNKVVYSSRVVIINNSCTTDKK